MIEQVVRYILPAAFSVVPSRLGSVEAAALLTAIGLQESHFEERRQRAGGPARGFWQFEVAGILGVDRHPRARAVLGGALMLLRYRRDLSVQDIYAAIEHNDVLAAVLARCLLLTHPDALPAEDQPDVGWRIYLATWRPGQPKPCTWPALYTDAWSRQRVTAAPAGSTPIRV